MPPGPFQVDHVTAQHLSDLALSLETALNTLNQQGRLIHVIHFPEGAHSAIVVSVPQPNRQPAQRPGGIILPMAPPNGRLP